MARQSFSETPITYPDGQVNVGDLPESLIDNGFIPKQQGVRGQPLPAQWLNWLFREIFRQINKDRVDNGAGLDSIVQTDEGVIEVYAVVKNDTTKYLHAIGYKVAGNAPSFKVLGSATLSFGTLSPSVIAISGAATSDVALRTSIRN